MSDSARSHAAFIARVTAGVSHEVRNVLAIVKESAGLVDDLVLVAGPHGTPDTERMRQALERIEVQVTRGAELMTSLNRIAHGLDRIEEPVDLEDAVHHAARLCSRFARLGRRRVEVRETGPDVTVTANSLEIYMALVAGLEWHLRRIPEGGTAVLALADHDGGPAVRFDADVRGEDAAPDEWADLVDELRGLPVSARPDGGAAFSLVFG